jgi:hypothetical protein
VSYRGSLLSTESRAIPLVKRSDKGDVSATECLSRLSFLNVPPVDPKTERTSPGEQMSLSATGPLPDPANFPPETFEAYVKAVNAAASFRVDEHVDEWSRFWAARGDKEAVLNAVEAYDGGRSFLYGDSKLRFELTLQVRGKLAAYDALLTAQRSRYSWNRYFSRSEDVRYVWTKVKEIYPEKWLAFLQNTLMSDPERINRSGVTVQSYISRLVEFLLTMEQPEIAKAVSRAAIATALQLVPLKLPAPSWIPGRTP